MIRKFPVFWNLGVVQEEMFDGVRPECRAVIKGWRWNEMEQSVMVS
jgi:hypothetical protein